MVRNFELLRRRSEARHALSRADYLLLRLLETGGPTDINGLASALGLDPSTAGRQVNGMETAGLVERSRSAEDRRRWIVAPTDRGRQLSSETRERRRAATADLLVDWEAADLRTLAD